jgi:hypothetical protein
VHKSRNSLVVPASRSYKTIQPSSLNPQPSSLNPHPSTLNPHPSSLINFFYIFYIFYIFYTFLLLVDFFDLDFLRLEFFDLDFDLDFDFDFDFDNLCLRFLPPPNKEPKDPLDATSSASASASASAASSAGTPRAGLPDKESK